MNTFSVLVNGQCWDSGLSESVADSFAAELRLEGRKHVLVIPE